MTRRTHHFSRTAHFLAVPFLLLGSALAAFGQQPQEQRDFDYGERLFREGLYELSAIQFETFPDRYPTSPKSPDAQWMAAESLFRLKRFDAAREAYLRYILRFPDAKNPDLAQFRMAECFDHSGRTGAASQSYWQVYILYPKSRWAGESILRCASLAAQSDSLARSETVLRTILEMPGYPESRPKAVFLLSDILRRRNRPDEAVRILKPMASRPARDPDRIEASIRLGTVFSEIGDWSPAKDQFRGILASPGVPDSLRRIAGFRLGRIEALTGDHADACQSFEACIATGAAEADGDDIRWWLGLSLAASGRESEALKVFQEVDPSGPRGPSAAFEAAMGLVRMNRLDEAESAFTPLAEHAPAAIRVLSLLALADAQCRRGSFMRASASYGRFLSEFPGDPSSDRVLLRKAVLDMEMNGRPEEAFESLERLWNAFPASICIPESQFRYAGMLARLGRTEESRLLLRRLITHQPFSSWADSAGAFLERIEWTVPLQGTGLAGALAPILNASFGTPSPSFEYDLGLFYFDSLKDYNAARSRLLSWLRNTPDSSRADSAWFRIAEGYFRRAVLERNPHLFDSARSSLGHIRPGPLTSPLVIRCRLMEYRIAAGRGSLDADRWIADLPPSCLSDPVEETRLFSLARSALSIDSIATAERILALIPTRPQGGFGDGSAGAALLRAMIESRRDRIETADSLLDRLCAAGVPPSVRSASCWMRGRRAEIGGRVKEAASLYRKAGGHPFFLADGDSVLLSLGNALLESGEPAEAALVFEKVLASDSVSASCARLGLGGGGYTRRPVILRRLAEAYIAGREIEKARKTLLRYGAAVPGPEGRRILWTALSSLAEAEHQDETARFFLYRCASSDSSDAGWAKLADLDYRLGRYEDAVTGYARAADAARSESLKAGMTVGQIASLFRLDRLAEGESARKAFESRFKSDPSFREMQAEIRLEQGMALTRNKSFEQAVECFENVRDSRKSALVPRAEMEHGRALLLMNRTDKGLGLLTDLIRQYAEDPILPEIYLILGEHYLRSGQTDNALAAFKKALADSLNLSASTSPAARRGGSERNSNISSRQIEDSPPLAAGSFNPAVGREAARQCIRLYEGLQMTDAAIALTKRYLARFPGAEDAFAKKIRLGIYYYELKEYERAVEQLRSLQPESEPVNEAEIQYWIGKCYAEMGRFDEAIFEFLKVKYLCPPTQLPWASTALYEAGMAYLRLQRPDSARQMFTRIVQSEGASSDLGRIAKQRADAIE
jgi:tetratricopeptide (TPR) repeat protein